MGVRDVVAAAFVGWGASLILGARLLVPIAPRSTLLATRLLSWPRAHLLLAVPPTSLLTLFLVFRHALHSLHRTFHHALLHSLCSLHRAFLRALLHVLLRALLLRGLVSRSENEKL